MNANFKFIKRNSNGKYSSVTVNEIAVDDLNHAARKVSATCRKNNCFFNVNGSYFPYGFVTLAGKSYRVDVNRDGSTKIVEPDVNGAFH